MNRQRIRRTLSCAIVLVSIVGLAPTGARAVPVGPPDVRIDYRQSSDDPLTYHVVAKATDADGRISSLQLCVDSGGSDACVMEVRGSEPGVLEHVEDCAFGDSASVEQTITFPEPGNYRAIATAIAGGCPVLGSEQTATSEDEIPVTVDRGPVFDPIVCADEGERAASDRGVSESAVKIASVVTLSGPGSSFSGGAATALQSIVRHVNRSGGVCGRSVQLEMYDDGGDDARSAAYVRNLLEANEHFALVAMPSITTALRDAIKDGSVERAGMPIVGTMARTEAEFSSRWVWPVGSSSRSYARAVAQHAYDAGARTFAVVFDTTSPWTASAARHYGEQVTSMPGATMVTSVPVHPRRASYSAEVFQLNGRCEGGCDAIFYAMDAQTALTFIAGRPHRAAVEDSLSLHLLDDRFASNCGRACDGMIAWTGFHPPIGDAPSESERFRDDVPDHIDPITMGSYHAMVVLAQALGRSGVTLTRARLADALGSPPFVSALVGGPLDWATSRRANKWVRGYAVVSAQGAFAGWRESGDWIAEP